MLCGMKIRVLFQVFLANWNIDMGAAYNWRALM